MENINLANSPSIEQRYQKKTQLEHILLRPDTYVGSTVKETQLMWVFDEESQRIVQKNVTFVPGLYKIFDEILVNAADNRQRDASMNELKVNINVNEGSISVYNNGQGIPVKMHKTEGVYVPELIFGHLLTSSNYDDSQKKTTGGRNGYGAKLTNIFSTQFHIETSHKKSGKKYSQMWYDNMSNMDAPKLSKCSSKDYTCVTFTPDYARFKMLGLDNDIISIIKKRVYDIAGTAPKGLKVYINDEKLRIKSFSDYVSLYIKDKTNILFDIPHERWEIAVCASDGHFQQVSFVNNIATIKGGSHVKHVTDQIVDGLQERIKKKNKKMDIKPQYIKNHLWVFVNSFIENPAFDSQTKITLATREKDFGSKCDISGKYLDNIMKTNVISSILEWAKFQKNKQLKKTDGKKKTKLLGINKLEDANEAGGRNSNKCTLIITEGDSAKALAVSGLSVVGRDYYGVYPLRGKLLNVREAKVSVIQKNEEITALKKILGLKHGVEYNDTKSLRYGHLMIMTDQDHDGSHIKGLVVNFLHTFWPSLLKINGFLNVFITPIVKCTKNKNVLNFYTLPEYNEWKSLNNDGKGWSIKYYKGLGTSTSLEGKEYFSDLKRHKLDMVWEDDNNDNDAILTAFSKKMADNRKEWMRSHEYGTFLNMTTVDRVSISDFINKELILFSIASNERAIPSMVDGLKPGQRKILYTGFKKKLFKEVKVATYSGYVSQIAAYHHGEASLHQTIVALAQNYVGSNNINLLIPAGQFGTRAMGGKDHASARYIFTHISRIARYIFPEDDDHILEYLDDDGKLIEPKYFLPIIPMALINGSSGIGTGWSTMIPNYNPRDIVNNILKLLDNHVTSRIHPFYKNFGGTIEETKNGYRIYGNIEQIDDTTVNITELPIGKWTQDYKAFLESLMEKQHVISYTEHHRDDYIDFMITMNNEKLIEANKKGLSKYFKLDTTISLSNMVLFNQEGRLEKYNDVDSILKEFYNIRLNGYRSRKEFLANKLSDELIILKNKVRFILNVINNNIKIKNIKKNILIKQLIDDGYTAYPKTLLDKKKKNNNNEDDEDDSESDSDDSNNNNNNNNDYDYLLNMPLLSLTKEKVDKLQAKLKEKENELNILINTDIKDMWRNDLQRFILCLDEIEEEEFNSLNNNNNKIYKKNKSGGRKKKVINYNENNNNNNILLKKKMQTVIEMSELEREVANKNKRKNKKNNNNNDNNDINNENNKKNKKKLLMPPKKTLKNNKKEKKLEKLLDFDEVNSDVDDDESDVEVLSLAQRLAKRTKISNIKKNNKDESESEFEESESENEEEEEEKEVQPVKRVRRKATKKAIVVSDSEEDEDDTSDFDMDEDDISELESDDESDYKPAKTTKKPTKTTKKPTKTAKKPSKTSKTDIKSIKNNNKKKLGPKSTSNKKRTVTARKAIENNDNNNNNNVTPAPKRSKKYITNNNISDEDYEEEEEKDDNIIINNTPVLAKRRGRRAVAQQKKSYVIESDEDEEEYSDDDDDDDMNDESSEYNEESDKIYKFIRSFFWLQHTDIERNLYLTAALLFAFLPIVAYNVSLDQHTDQSLEFQTSLWLLVWSPFLAVVAHKGLLAWLDTNFEQANTRFIERLGNYRVLTCGQYAKKTNLYMQEETSAQDILDLIKWRTVCSFFWCEDGPPFIEKETVLKWTKAPRYHSRKLERLLKLPYNWRTTWRKLTTGVFSSRYDTETGIGEVVSDDNVSRLMWRRIELSESTKQTLVSYTLAAFIASMPIAQAVYWWQKANVLFRNSEYFIMLIHLVIVTIVLGEFFITLNMGNLWYQMAIYRIRLFECLTQTNTGQNYGLPYLSLKFPTNRLAWWRMRDQERHWFEWVTRQARRSTEWAVVVLFGFFISALVGTLLNNPLHETLTNSMFMIPLLLIITWLTIKNTSINFQVNKMDESQIYKLRNMQIHLTQEYNMRLERKDNDNTHHCDYYLVAVSYCPFCHYVEFPGCHEHRRVFSLSEFGDIPSCFAFKYNENSRKVEESGCYLSVKATRSKQFGQDIAAPSLTCLNCSHTASLQYWVLPSRTLDVVKLRGDYEEETDRIKSQVEKIKLDKEMKDRERRDEAIRRIRDRIELERREQREQKENEERMYRMAKEDDYRRIEEAKETVDRTMRKQFRRAFRLIVSEKEDAYEDILEKKEFEEQRMRMEREKYEEELINVAELKEEALMTITEAKTNELRRLEDEWTAELRNIRERQQQEEKRVHDELAQLKARKEQELQRMKEQEEERRKFEEKVRKQREEEERIKQEEMKRQQEQDERERKEREARQKKATEKLTAAEMAILSPVELKLREEEARLAEELEALKAKFKEEEETWKRDNFVDEIAVNASPKEKVDTNEENIDKINDNETNTDKQNDDNETNTDKQNDDNDVDNDDNAINQNEIATTSQNDSTKDDNDDDKLQKDISSVDKNDNTVDNEEKVNNNINDDDSENNENNSENEDEHKSVKDLEAKYSDYEKNMSDEGDQLDEKHVDEPQNTWDHTKSFTDDDDDEHNNVSDSSSDVSFEEAYSSTSSEVSVNLKGGGNSDSESNSDLRELGNLIKTGTVTHGSKEQKSPDSSNKNEETKQLQEASDSDSSDESKSSNKGDINDSGDSESNDSDSSSSNSSDDVKTVKTAEESATEQEESDSQKSNNNINAEKDNSKVNIEDSPSKRRLSVNDLLLKQNTSFRNSGDSSLVNMMDAEIEDQEVELTKEDVKILLKRQQEEKDRQKRIEEEILQRREEAKLEIHVSEPMIKRELAIMQKEDAHAKQEGDDEYRTKSVFKHEEKMRPKRFVLQCSECCAVIFPHEIMLEGIHQIVDYFLYSENIIVVSTPNLFEPVDDMYRSQEIELAKRLMDNERVDFVNEHYHPTVIAWVLVLLLREFGGLLSARTMELLCEVRTDAMSYRAVMAYHRTNPLFDRIVGPFFVMLKHVALFQGLKRSGGGYEFNALRDTENRFVERFARIISKGNRGDTDRLKQVLLLLIHHAVVIFQPIWPTDHPRPPHVDDMLKRCARQLYALIWDTEVRYGLDSWQYKYLVSTCPLFDKQLDFEELEARRLMKEGEIERRRIRNERLEEENRQKQKRKNRKQRRRKTKRTLKKRDKEGSTDNNKNTTDGGGGTIAQMKKSKKQSSSNAVNSSTSSDNNDNSSKGDSSDGSSSNESTASSLTESSSSSSSSSSTLKKPTNNTTNPVDNEGTETTMPNNEVNVQGGGIISSNDENNDSCDDNSDNESYIHLPFVNPYRTNTTTYNNSNSNDNNNIYDETNNARRKSKDNELNVQEIFLKGGGKRYDFDDDDLLDILEMKANKLPNDPFEIAKHNNKLWKERDFVDWYVHQVYLFSHEYQPIASGAGFGFHYHGYNCANSSGKAFDSPTSDITSEPEKSVSDLISSGSLLKIPVYMHESQLDRLAYWSYMNLLSSHYMEQREHSMWKTDMDVLQVWQAQLKSGQDRGKFFGFIRISRIHLVILIFFTFLTILKEIWTIYNFDDPNKRA